VTELMCTWLVMVTGGSIKLSLVKNSIRMAPPATCRAILVCQGALQEIGDPFKIRQSIC